MKRELEPDLASIGQRIRGRVIDQIIIVPFQIWVVLSSDLDSSTGTLRVAAVPSIVALLVASVYEVALTARFGQTVGKMVVGTRVVRVGARNAIGLERSLARWSLPAIFGSAGRLSGSTSGTAVLLALAVVAIYGWAFIDPRRQGLHDKAAGTIVVRTGDAIVVGE